MKANTRTRQGESIGREASVTVRDRRWAAVVARDRAADESFVYAVRTTGIYCRPSCAARRANPANVSFHDNARAARAAGFRPCRRCRPDEPREDHRHHAAVTAACRAIEAADSMPTLTELARRARLSPSHFHRLFKAATGLTPRDFALSVRASRVRKTLRAADTVTRAIQDAGFESAAPFYAATGRMLGMTPAEYRRGGAQLEIGYATQSCSLGTVLVASTTVGVCAVLLGDSAAELEHELLQRFPRATLRAADETFSEVVASVVGLIDRPGHPVSLPLDLHGTIFQQRVWKALQDVPPGTTMSYGQLANRLGMPSSVRAVARACGANPVAVVVPCHRVVSRDGALTGYRWGVERKRALLERERPQASPSGRK